MTTAPLRLTTSALRYVRDGRTILSDASLSVVGGESVAVTGPSGSGKSSLLALLAGLERPDAGQVSRPGSGARFGLVLQGYGLLALLTAAENVEVPLQAGVLGRLPGGQVRARAAAQLAALGLAEVVDHLTEQLSGGQQQRVAIARALVVEPAVVIADELTAELDHDSKQLALDRVLEVAARGGIVVLATHDPDVAARCDRTVRLVDGALLD